MPTYLYTNCAPSCSFFDDLHLHTPWDETSSINDSLTAYGTTCPEAVLQAETMVDRQVELAQLFSDSPRLRRHAPAVFVQHFQRARLLQMSTPGRCSQFYYVKVSPQTPYIIS